MIQFSREQALEIAESGIWKNWSDEEVVKFQLYQRRLCIPFSRFHEAVERVLGRGVYTHEFAFADNLKEEYEGKRGKPTFEEIINLFPSDKPVFLVVAGDEPENNSSTSTMTKEDKE